MTQHDPATRHLSRDELARALDAVRDSDPDEATTEPETTLWSRRALTAVPTAAREPATVLEIAATRHDPQVAHPKTVVIGHGKVEHHTPALSPSPWLKRIGVGVMVAGLASAVWWVGLGRPLQKHEVSAHKAARSAQSKQEVRSALEKPAPMPAALDTTPPSERAAVDLLLAGRMHDALDAYRALALHKPEQVAFAAVVAQLEWEIADCKREGTPCAQ